MFKTISAKFNLFKTLSRFSMIVLTIIILANIFLNGIGSAYAYLGQTISQMQGECSNYHQISLSVVSNPNSPILNYNALKKFGVIAYNFNCSGYSLNALFNSEDICFRIYISESVSALPDPSLLIGPIAEETPVILSKYENSFMKNEFIRYGSGANAVIYEIMGLKSSPSALAYYASQKP